MSAHPRGPSPSCIVQTGKCRLRQAALHLWVIPSLASAFGRLIATRHCHGGGICKIYAQGTCGRLCNTVKHRTVSEKFYMLSVDIHCSMHV